MARTVRRTRVVGNTGRRASGKTRPKYKSRDRSNPGDILGFTLAAAGNPGRKARHMKTKKKAAKKPSSHRARGSRSKYKANTGRARRHSTHRRNAPKHSIRRYKRNTGRLGGIGPMVTNAVFVIVGALGSKLGAQAVLGTNNVGLLGYAGNAAAGGLLWFLADKVMRNPAASAGVLAGTIVQIVLRILNDYTPFGGYLAQLGMGDYQMQSFVTPQVLVDPMRNAEIQQPPGWGPTPMMLPPAPSSPASANGGGAPASSGGGSGAGMSGLYGGGWGGGLYG